MRLAISRWLFQINLCFFIEMNDLHSLARIIAIESDTNLIASVKNFAYFFKELILK